MTFGRSFIHILAYGAALALLLFLLSWLELRFLVFQHGFEIYAGLIAVFFTGLGIWLATKLLRPKVKTLVVEKTVAPAPIIGMNFVPDPHWLERSGLSARELEVLGHMARGLSNQEIAEQLFVSQNTVKTHAARLYEKLEVKNRVQAIETGRRMGLIP